MTCFTAEDTKESMRLYQIISFVESFNLKFTNFLGAIGCFGAASLALWQVGRFDSGTWDRACEYSGLAAPCILFKKFLDFEVAKFENRM